MWQLWVYYYTFDLLKVALRLFLSYAPYLRQRYSLIYTLLTLTESQNILFMNTHTECYIWTLLLRLCMMLCMLCSMDVLNALRVLELRGNSDCTALHPSLWKCGVKVSVNRHQGALEAPHDVNIATRIFSLEKARRVITHNRKLVLWFGSNGCQPTRNKCTSIVNCWWS